MSTDLGVGSPWLGAVMNESEIHILEDSLECPSRRCCRIWNDLFPANWEANNTMKKNTYKKDKTIKKHSYCVSYAANISYINSTINYILK